MTSKQVARKGKLIETIKDRSGLSVEIRLRSKSLIFEAEMPDGSILEDKDGSLLKTRIDEWFKENADLDWTPVIEISVLTPFDKDSGAFVGFSINRFYYAKKHNGKYLWLFWDYKGWKERNPITLARQFYYAGENFNLPAKRSDKYYLPYSDETWAGLNKLIEAIEELKVRLHEMLETNEGLELLRRVGQDMLKLLPDRTEDA